MSMSQKPRAIRSKKSSRPRAAVVVPLTLRRGAPAGCQGGLQVRLLHCAQQRREVLRCGRPAALVRLGGRHGVLARLPSSLLALLLLYARTPPLASGDLVQEGGEGGAGEQRAEVHLEEREKGKFFGCADTGSGAGQSGGALGTMEGIIRFSTSRAGWLRGLHPCR